jgi:PAS domain S-box-containing protein
MISGSAPLRVLLVEDSADDSELVLQALRDGGLAVESWVAATEAEFRDSLAPRPDIIIVDWMPPGFSGPAALAVANELAPTVPCILISGVLSEDVVAAALQHGAAACVPRERRDALAAVGLGLTYADARRERDRLRTATEEALESIVIAGDDGRIVYFNRAFADDVGRERGNLMGQSLAPILADLLGAAVVASMVEKVATGVRWIREVEVEAADGVKLWFQVAAAPRADTDGSIGSYVVTFFDVTQLRSAKGEIDLQSRVRVALAEALHQTPAEATLAQAAQSICDQLVTLPVVQLACIHAYLGADRFQLVAGAPSAGCPSTVADGQPTAWAAHVLERSRAGPWAEMIGADQAGDGWAAPLVAAGLKAAAFGPITCGDTIVGFLLIGTRDGLFARKLMHEMPGLVSFSSASSALLAERMLASLRDAELGESLKSLLGSGSFHPVFQPIVDLESREIVGYEALTRFDSGRRPDLCFADAWRVGLGADLEIGTLAASLAEAKRLPAGRWLDLNASPRLLTDLRLSETLWQADRPLVVEITEHEVIEDYRAAREAILAVGNDIRIAVDDAGVGVANFGHIIDLRPDFVKLDISLVRRVNANLGRQALVVGMRHFSRTAGCRLVAEGVETEEEARALRELGVEYGQGYLFGRPERVEEWAMAPVAVKSHRESGPAGRASARRGSSSPDLTRVPAGHKPL